MQEASLVGVFKTILIILLVYFGLKLIFRWFGPIILKYFMKKMGEKAFKNFSQMKDFQQQNNQQKRTKNSIHNSKKEKKGKEEVGEYIDYEEID